jgi:hypothetical protein
MYKRSDKLPRGSYFYVAVGQQVYAGREPVTQVTTDVSAEYKIARGYTKQTTGARNMAEQWAGGNAQWRRNEAQDAALGPKSWRARQRTVYNIAREATPPAKPVATPTGALQVRLGEFSAAKQFRKRAQAETVCEELNRLYAGLNVKVSIELHEG